MKILVTGGAGYIGSHTVIELYEAGHQAVVVDNLSNSSEEALRRVEKIVSQSVPFYKVDLRDKDALEKVFSEHKFDAAIHFAGLKAVGESVSKPLEYYENNLIGTVRLLQTMQSADVKNLVFSSSATVYGEPKKLPLNESLEVPARATNPYGQTKLSIELMLEDLVETNTGWSIINLRYFNPVGAHESGTIGEDPKDIPNNLMPYITQVAIGRLDKLSVFSDDYETPDGTGVRDYIHVVDLAKGHVAAINNLPNNIKTYNLGTGKGVTVLEMVEAFEKTSGKNIPYQIVDRRPGDVAVCYADARLAEKELGWKAEESLEDMCRDAWRWQSQNPNGYR